MGARGPKPGSKKPPGAGRKKGAPNKRTLDLIKRLEELGVDPADNVIAILKMKPHKDPTKGLMLSQKLDGWLRLMRFVYPERKAIDVAPTQELADVIYRTQWKSAPEHETPPNAPENKDA